GAVAHCRQRGRGRAAVPRAERRRPGADAIDQDVLLAELRHGRRPLRRVLDGLHATLTGGAACGGRGATLAHRVGARAGQRAESRPLLAAVAARCQCAAAAGRARLTRLNRSASGTEQSARKPMRRKLSPKARSVACCWSSRYSMPRAWPAASTPLFGASAVSAADSHDW